MIHQVSENFKERLYRFSQANDILSKRTNLIIFALMLDIISTLESMLNPSKPSLSETEKEESEEDKWRR